MEWSLNNSYFVLPSESHICLGRSREVLTCGEPPGCWFLRARLYQEAVSCRAQNFQSVALREQDFGQWLLLEVVAFVLKPRLGLCCGPLSNLSIPLPHFTSHCMRCFFLLGSEGPYPTPQTLPPFRFCPSLRDLVMQAFNPKLHQS